MKIITDEQIENLNAFLNKYDSFIIAGHKEPDGDCISCCLGLAYVCKFLKKKVILVNEGPFKRTEIKSYANKFVNKVPAWCYEEKSKCAMLSVDCSEFERLGDIGQNIDKFDTFIIDHHKTAEVKGINHIIDSTAPAAACLIQQVVEKICQSIPEEIAKILFFGLSTDTGFFRFLTNDSEEVFHSAARLVASGANPRTTYQEITSGKPWNTRKLLGILLDRAERYENGKLVITYETLEDTKKYGQEGRDSDALYSLMLEVESVEAVAFVRQDTEFTCTLGLRSKDKCDVSLIAKAFGGGGHKNAYGASTEGVIKDILPRLITEFSKQLS